MKELKCSQCADISFCMKVHVTLCVKESMFVVQGDICEPDFMRYIFQEEKIDTVLHFAAQSHVGMSQMLTFEGFKLVH